MFWGSFVSSWVLQDVEGRRQRPNELGQSHMDQLVAKKRWISRPVWLLLGGLLALAAVWLIRTEIDRQISMRLSRPSTTETSEGTLVIVGGGDVPHSARRKFMELPLADILPSW